MPRKQKQVEKDLYYTNVKISIYHINKYDIVIEDRVNEFIRLIYYSPTETLKPTTDTIKYGKNFVNEMTETILYRTPQRFKNSFIKYCKEHLIFQEIIEEIKSIEEVNLITSNKIEREENNQ